MNCLSSIQQNYWKTGSLGPDATVETLPGKVGSRTISNVRREAENYRQMDTDGDSFVSFRTEYWATPSETAWKTVNVQLLPNGFDATHIRDGKSEPSQLFSARWTDPAHMQTLALIPGPAGVAAIARTLQFGGPSVQEQKRFF